MVLEARAEALVAASPEELLSFVLDVEEYRQVDRKITKSWGMVGPDEAGAGSVWMIAQMKGLPPAPYKQDFTLDRWRSLRFVGSARQPGRAVVDFLGLFECEPAANGETRVVHSYRIEFKGPFRRSESWLDRWLQDQLDDEVAQLRQRFAPAS